MNIFQRIQRRLEDEKFRRIIAQNNFNGFKKIYHYHIMKSGGTTINYAFLNLKSIDPAKIYLEVCHYPYLRKQLDDMVYVHGNQYLINKGEFSYAHSHYPMWKLKATQEDTYTFTLLRDPIQRALSRYQELVSVQHEDYAQQIIAPKKAWLNDGFEAFLVHEKHRESRFQLYMFSQSFSADEAYSRIKQLNYFGFTEHLALGMKHLSEELGLDLQYAHHHKSKRKISISLETYSKAKEFLAEEYRLYNTLKQEWESQHLNSNLCKD